MTDLVFCTGMGVITAIWLVGTLWALLRAGCMSNGRKGPVVADPIREARAAGFRAGQEFMRARASRLCAVSYPSAGVPPPGLPSTATGDFSRGMSEGSALDAEYILRLEILDEVGPCAVCGLSATIRSRSGQFVCSPECLGG